MISFREVIDRFRARRPLWSIYPTPRLAAVVLAFSSFWFIPVVGNSLAPFALALVFVAVIVDYGWLPRRSAFDVERAAPEMIGLGEGATLRYVIRSRWSWKSDVRLYDEIPPAFNGGVTNDVMVAGPRSELVVEVPIEAQLRGRFSYGKIALELRSPLGLLKRIVRFDPGGDVVVVPSLANVRRFHLLAMHNRLSDAGVRALNHRGEGGALAGLRDYVPGDDPRLLDWKATARHERPIVREQTIERSQSVMILMDCGRGMTQAAGQYSRFEHALSAALVFTDVAAASGD
ncbi:MAG TPA: DUF58 domain-containing protein, partial [Gemmatimonadaceae bacterium]